MEKKKYKGKKRSVDDIRAYWVGVGVALGHAGNGNISDVFNEAKSESLKTGFNREFGSPMVECPSYKAKMFKHQPYTIECKSQKSYTPETKYKK